MPYNTEYTEEVASFKKNGTSVPRDNVLCVYLEFMKSVCACKSH